MSKVIARLPSHPGLVENFELLKRCMDTGRRSSFGDAKTNTYGIAV